MGDGVRVLVDGTVVVSVAAAVVLLHGRRPVRLHGGGAHRQAPRWWTRPEAALAAVTGLIFLNQALFTVYVLRVHGGDPAFVARHLPPGWFELADGSAALRWLAAHVPAPELLAPTVLRVQAVLELPFVLLAVLAALRWLDPGLYRRAALTGLLWAAAASYTFVFCVVEWDLRNPYTVDDLVLRCVAGLLTPPLLAALARREPGEPVRRPSAGGLLLFAVSLAALGYLVLVVYETALLYNLGRADEAAPGAAVALLALVAARRRAARDAGEVHRRARAGGVVAVVGRGLWWFLALFWVPALAIRYGVTFGTPLLAAATGLGLLSAASAMALRDVRAEAAAAGRTVGWPGLAGRVGAAALAGTVAAGAAALPLTDRMYEAALFAAAIAFLLTLLAVGRMMDGPVPAMRRKEQPAERRPLRRDR